MKVRLFAICLTFVTAVFTTSCKQTQNKEKKKAKPAGATPSGGANSVTGAGGPTGAFLRVTDFSPAGLTSLADQDALDELNEESSFYNHSPAATDSCSALLSSMPLRYSNGMLVFSASLDMKACLSDANRQVQISNASMKVYGTISCPGVDLSSFDGKSIGSTIDMDSDPCLAARKNGQSFMNSESSITMTAAGQSLTIHNRSARMNPNTGGPCTAIVSGTSYLDNNCSSFDYTSTQQGSTLRGIFHRLDYVSTAHEQGNTFYRSGSINFRINNWQGKMSYAGPSAPPTFTMTNGTQTKTGTYTGQSRGAELVASPALPRGWHDAFTWRGLGRP